MRRCIPKLHVVVSTQIRLQQRWQPGAVGGAAAAPETARSAAAQQAPAQQQAAALSIDLQLGKMRTALKHMVDKMSLLSDQGKAHQQRMDAFETDVASIGMLRTQLDELHVEVARLQGTLTTLRSTLPSGPSVVHEARPPPDDDVSSSARATAADSGGAEVEVKLRESAASETVIRFAGDDAATQAPTSTSKARADHSPSDMTMLAALEARIAQLEQQQQRADHARQSLVKTGIAAEVDFDGDTVLTASRVEVRDLPSNMRNIVSLKTHMEAAGPVRSCLLRRLTTANSAAGSDGHTTQEMVALVTYADVQDAVRAVENLNRTQFAGSTISVRPCAPPPAALR